jgi:hypothetical protein
MVANVWSHGVVSNTPALGWSGHARHASHGPGAPITVALAQGAEPTRPWAALPLTDDIVTMTFFKASSICLVGDGCSTMFWSNTWLNGISIANWAPDLFAAVHPRRRGSRKVREALMHNAWMRDIIGALTVSVLIQYVCLREQLEQVELNPDLLDSIT